jgi:hypothetical protein
MKDPESAALPDETQKRRVFPFLPRSGRKINLSFLLTLCLLYAGAAFPFFPTAGQAPQQVADLYRPEGRDGRGRPGPGDDKIYRIVPRQAGCIGLGKGIDRKPCGR